MGAYKMSRRSQSGVVLTDEFTLSGTSVVTIGDRMEMRFTLTTRDVPMLDLGSSNRILWAAWDGAKRRGLMQAGPVGTHDSRGRLALVFEGQDLTGGYGVTSLPRSCDCSAAMHV